MRVRYLACVVLLSAPCATVAHPSARHEYRISLRDRSLREVAAKGPHARHFQNTGAAAVVEPLATAADALSAWYAAVPASERAAASFRFPRSTPFTPRRIPCPLSRPATSPDDATWSHPTWKALGFRPKVPLRHQLRFVSTGRGAEAMFALVARGDADCNRKRSTFRISGHARGGKLIMNVLRLRSPHE